jgi:hypothetical protein
MGLLQIYLDQNVAVVGWAIAVISAAAWTAFAWWRGYRLFQAFGIRGDRRFDQREKFALPSEYRTSESATRTKQKRRMVQRDGS